MKGKENRVDVSPFKMIQSKIEYFFGDRFVIYNSIKFISAENVESNKDLKSSLENRNYLKMKS